MIKALFERRLNNGKSIHCPGHITYPDCDFISFICLHQVCGQKSTRNRLQFNQEASVALLQVSERIFLVGITPHNISLLTELDDETLLQEASLPEEDNYAPPFKDLLLKMKDRK